MTTPKELRAALEKSQQESLDLRGRLTAITAELELAKAQLMQSQGEQERLIRLLLEGLNSQKGKSAFSIDDVPALVSYLKKK